MKSVLSKNGLLRRIIGPISNAQLDGEGYKLMRNFKIYLLRLIC
jgi:hypothetical protein